MTHEDEVKALENADGYVDEINQKMTFLKCLIDGKIGPDGQDNVTMINKLIDSPLTSAYLP
jgi:hypothetical protein